MSKQVLFLLLFAAVIGIMPSCQKDPKPQDEGKKDEMTAREREIYNMLESAGRLSNEIPAKFGDPQKTRDLDSTKTPAVQGNQSGIRITKTKQCDFGQSDGEFTLLNPWAGILWPGALIQGGSLRGKAVPSSIPLYRKRKPGRIILQVVGGNGKLGDEKWYKECPMRESDVVQAQNELIRQFLTSKTQAQYSITVSSVYSKDDLKVKAGINIKGFGGQFDAAFAGSWNEERSHVLVKVEQKYFTITYEDPDGGFRGVFTDDVTQQELAPYTGNGNPICYVSSVSYGRVYYLLIESSEDSRSLEVCANGSYSSTVDVEVKASLDQLKKQKNLKISAFQYGGNASEGMKVAMNYSPDELLQFLQKGAEFDADNVGAPISFSVKHLYDNSPVHMVNTLSYEYKQTTFVPDDGGDNLSLMIDDVIFEGTPDDDYKFSCKGKYKVTDAKLIVNKRVKGSTGKMEDFQYKENLISSEWKRDLCSRSILPIKRCYTDTSSVNIKALELHVSGRIESNVWTRWESRTPDEADFSFTIAFSHNDKGEWKAEDSDAGNQVTSRQAFKSITLEKAGYRIKVTYRLYKNNVLLSN